MQCIVKYRLLNWHVRLVGLGENKKRRRASQRARSSLIPHILFLLFCLPICARARRLSSRLHEGCVSIHTLITQPRAIFFRASLFSLAAKDRSGTMGELPALSIVWRTEQRKKTRARKWRRRRSQWGRSGHEHVLCVISVYWFWVPLVDIVWKTTNNSLI